MAVHRQSEKRKVQRGIFIGAEYHDVKVMKSDLVAWLKRTGVPRFDSTIGKESWFYLVSAKQMIGIFARSETIYQGAWNGRGWYHTSLRRVRGDKWLTLEKGDLFEAMNRRFAQYQRDHARFLAFVETLRKS